MDFKFIEVKYRELTQNVNDQIKKLYNKADINLSAADPYGHILRAVEAIFSTSMLYLKNVTAQFDINNPNNTNAKMIRTLARVGGYNPSRAVSSSGTISLQLRPSVDILEEIGGGEITIYNNNKISNKTNGLDYFIDLGQDKITFLLEPNKKYYLPVVQGTVERQVFTGTGENNQSFSVNLPNNKTVENWRVKVKVDGEIWSPKEHLYDILPDEKSYYMRTGMNGGLDLYFGTGNFGEVPRIGAEIEVTYVISDGTLGNLPHKKEDDWDYSDEVYDSFGATVDVEGNFITFIENEISMASDNETPEFTKSILPYASRNFVLARPEHYVFQLRRLNIFSQIDAFAKETKNEMGVIEDSIVNLFLVPNVSLYMGNGVSYFDLQLLAFYLEESERNKVLSYLRTQGNIPIGTGVRILEPTITKYIVNLYLRIFEDVREDNVRSEVYNKLSTYFIGMKRRGRVPKSDIIRIIEEVDGVDSVEVEFVSEANEKYHLEFKVYKESIMKANPTVNPDDIKLDGYEEDEVIGLDAQLGDIVYKKDELPIIRGGWKTRDGLFFNETPVKNGLGSVNISILGVSKRSF